MFLIPPVPQPTQVDGRITQTLHVLLACLRPVGWRPVWTGLSRFRVRVDVAELGCGTEARVGYTVRRSAYPRSGARVRAPLHQFGNCVTQAERVLDYLWSIDSTLKTIKRIAIWWFVLSVLAVLGGIVLILNPVVTLALFA